MDREIIAKNNLGSSVSPYLRQHSDNPIHWQEWSSELLDYAKKSKKKIFISIGYSTCHWCHVMASEAFSDKEISDYLNKNFISIKIDREQRPDIDQFFMTFMTATTGRGGWPLNVFLTHNAEPIVAFTYLPVESKRGLPSFMDMLIAVYERGEALSYQIDERPAEYDKKTLHSIIDSLISMYDYPHGGFGKGAKFPPSCALLLLISYYERYRAGELKDIIESTLDSMMSRGLCDHLQGGFFRYCVDREWTIPHFEKMLYDQAMLLWVYSWALKVFDKPEYKNTVAGIIESLDETFFYNGLYISAHDADTNHKEGETYLWGVEELKERLNSAELEYLLDNYFITDEGNFEGKNHLIRIRGFTKGPVEKKLLDIRNKRIQPFADRKIITSWNALTGIALIMAWRATGDRSILDKAEALMDKLIELHFNDGKLSHSSFEGVQQKEEFLEDSASLLLFATYLHEENRNREKIILLLVESVKKYFKGEWYENINNDFENVKASVFDHPVPSSLSLVTLAMLRYSLLLNISLILPEEKHVLWSEFYSLAVFMSDGHWHVIHSPEVLSWDRLSLNSIQVPGNKFSDCFEGSCNDSLIK